MLPKRNVPKLPPVLTTKYCAISPNWADQHSPYLLGLCFVHAGPTEASRQIPTTPQGCFPGNESSWRKLARISAMVYLVYFHHGDIRKKTTSHDLPAISAFLPRAPSTKTFSTPNVYQSKLKKVHVRPMK